MLLMIACIFGNHDDGAILVVQEFAIHCQPSVLSVKSQNWLSVDTVAHQEWPVSLVNLRSIVIRPGSIIDFHDAVVTVEGNAVDGLDV